MDIVNVINYLSGRSYQTNEGLAVKQQEQRNTERSEPEYQQQQQQQQHIPTRIDDPNDSDETIEEKQQFFGTQPVEQQYEAVTSAYMEAQDYKQQATDKIEELIKEKSNLEETLTAQKEEQNNIEEKHKQEIENFKSKLNEKEDELNEKEDELKEKDAEISKLNKEAQTVSAELEKKVKEKAELGELFEQTEAKANDDAETIARIRAKKREYKKDYLEANKKVINLTRRSKEKDEEIKTLESEKDFIENEKEEIANEKKKLTKHIQAAEKSFAKKQEAFEAEISELKSNKSSLEKELNEVKAKNKQYSDNIKKLEEMISSLELTKSQPSKRTKQPAPKRLSESSVATSLAPMSPTLSEILSSTASSTRRKEPSVRRLQDYLVASFNDEFDYYDTQFIAQNIDKSVDDHKFAIDAFDANKENKLERIIRDFKKEAQNLYYFYAVSNESDKRTLFKLGNKTASEIFVGDSDIVYLTLVGPNLVNRLSDIQIKNVKRNDIKRAKLEEEKEEEKEESVFLGSGVTGGSFGRITGGSIFDDVKLFLRYFNISSMEKLPIIAKGKNTYLFRF
jgi:chromosome segregation ATPase